MLNHRNGSTTRRALICCGALLGCGGSGPAFKPAPTAQKAKQLEHAARASSSGVTLVAEADVWSGDRDVREQVTPVHIILTNQGQQPIRVQYRDFCLVSEGGKQFAALPPFEIRQGAVAPVAVSRDTPIQPKWKAQGFEMALAYAPLYGGGMDTANGPIDYDVAYYNEYFPAWSRQEEDLPTASLEQKAIPEGILQPGGSLDGFLYFERVPSDAQRLTLREQVVPASQTAGTSTAQAVGTLEIPFVQRK